MSSAPSLAETTDAERQAEFRGRMGVTKALALAAFYRPVVAPHRGAVAGAGQMFPLAADLVAAEALRPGVIDLLVPAEEPDAAAARAAADFAAKPQGSLSRIKRLANAAPGQGFAAHLSAEGEAIVEGVAALLETRPPRFA